MHNYGLYHTLNKGIKVSDKLTAMQERDLSKLLKTKNDDVKNACIMLIAEHAKYVDDIEIWVDNKIEFPYQGIYNSTDHSLQLNLDNIPVQLKIILYKFLDQQRKNQGI